jgi:hypothetical protein
MLFFDYSAKWLACTSCSLFGVGLGFLKADLTPPSIGKILFFSVFYVYFYARFDLIKTYDFILFFKRKVENH